MEAAGTVIGSSGGKLAVAGIADRPLHNRVHVVELTRSSRRYIGHGNPIYTYIHCRSDIVIRSIVILLVHVLHVCPRVIYSNVGLFLLPLLNF